MTEGFEEFLRERRERTERTRHLLVSVLAITCIALAVSNVVLALRLTSGRARQSAEPPARATSVPQAARPSGVTEPPARESTTSARTATDEAPPAVTLPKTSEPVRPDAAAPRGASPQPLEPPARAGKPRQSRLAELEAVTVPTLVVQGERDPFGIPPSGPTREVVTVRGDHGLKADLDAVGAAVREWMARVVAPA